MNASTVTTTEFPRRDYAVSRPLPATPALRADASAVSWAAIAAGAAAAAALSLSLLILGVGFGMATLSPWSPGALGATKLGVSSIIWLTVTSLLASSLGGYLAGRLRTRWADVHGDEVYFRDTAHGFLTWAVATLATASLLASMVGSIVSSGVKASAEVVGTAATAAVGRAAGTASGNLSMDYFIDTLFRRDSSAPGAWPEGAPPERTPAEDALEVRNIFAYMLASAPLPVEDVRHLGQLIARRTGLTQQAAETRVNDTYARAQAALSEVELRAKDAAEKARKATTYGSLWLFLALLGGAFAASLTATYGGRQRDR